MKPDTLAEVYRPLMDAPSVETRCCAVCGRSWPINRHHLVPRSAGVLHDGRGRARPKPTITLCGSGNASGCHGKAHSRRLHFRFEGQLEYLETDEPTRYLDALAMDGWRAVSPPEEWYL